jgi:hypothetical protein
MTKKEIKKIVALCQQGVTFRSGVEIILRIELNKKCHFLIPDKIISGIAQSISDFDSILPFKGRGNSTVDTIVDKVWIGNVKSLKEVKEDESA